MTWQRVGDAVDDRIAELDATKAAIARRAGIDPSTLWKVRRGRGNEVSTALLAKLERALRWPEGTFEAVYRGEDPPREVLTDAQRLEALERRVDSLGEALERVADRLDEVTRPEGDDRGSRAR